MGATKSCARCPPAAPAPSAKPLHGRHATSPMAGRCAAAPSPLQLDVKRVKGMILSGHSAAYRPPPGQQVGDARTPGGGAGAANPRAQACRASLPACSQQHSGCESPLWPFIQSILTSIFINWFFFPPTFSGCTTSWPMGAAASTWTRQARCLFLSFDILFLLGKASQTQLVCERDGRAQRRVPAPLCLDSPLLPCAVWQPGATRLPCIFEPISKQTRIFTAAV